MTRTNNAALLGLLLRNVAEVLAASGSLHEGRKLRDTPVNILNRFACILRAIPAVESTIRLRWGLRSGLSPNAPQAAAVEALDILRTGVTATLGSNEDETEWLTRLIVRAKALTRRVGGEPGEISFTEERK